MYPIQRNSDASRPALDLKAIVTGAVVDVSGTIHTEVLVGMLWTALLWSGGGEAALFFYILNLARGLGFTVLGGYFSGRTAGRHHLRHALVAGLISQVISIGLAVTNLGNAPFWYVVIGVLLTLPAALLGGLLSAATARPDTAAAEPHD